jgi:starch synthase (maltosyl-transferring)
MTKQQQNARRPKSSALDPTISEAGPNPDEIATDAAISSNNRILIENVYPTIDCGRYPVKRVIGEDVVVSADIFRDGHDILDATVLYRPDDELSWRRAPMQHRNNDRWSGTFPLERNIRYVFAIEAWTDLFASWRHDTIRKIEARQDVALELAEGRALIERHLEHTLSGEPANDLQQFLATESDSGLQNMLLGELLQNFMRAHGPRGDITRTSQSYSLIADRTRAVFAAWYEMFPRSQGRDPAKGATFQDCITRLPEIQAMGFDVLYFVPIHPIGRVNRKGPNNALNAGPDDPGSPYAIGSLEGGHDAIHPELGTEQDFARLVERCHELGMEVALDFAIQCAPDHPWAKEHPEWFIFRPDGTIRYAENPPKKYQDIVNVNFYGPHREALWNALRDVVLTWVDRGVKIFRVDNPHTKPVPFWEWMIREVQDRHPDTIFLSEAFTRPKMLKALAKAGFTQSYTYFTWRNFKQELIDYVVELTKTECREYLRPNFFANTPDILPEFLQKGGRPAFQIRLALAATLSGLYGIYNGFELCEADALPGREEYNHSEKYQYKVWDWDRPGNIKPFTTAINRIRRDNQALHNHLNVEFWRADHDSIIFYSKMTPSRDNMVFVAINLDPFEAHETTLWFPIAEIGLGDNDAFEAEELLTGVRHLWRGSPQHIRLDPKNNPVAIFRILVWRHVDYRTPNP